MDKQKTSKAAAKTTAVPSKAGSSKNPFDMSREEITGYLNLLRKDSDTAVVFAIRIFEYVSSLGIFLQVPFLKMFMEEARNILAKTQADSSTQTVPVVKTAASQKAKLAVSEVVQMQGNLDSDEEEGEGARDGKTDSNIEIFKSMDQLDKLMTETAKRWQAGDIANEKKKSKAQKLVINKSSMIEYKPEKDAKDLLKIVDLRPKYQVLLITDYDKDFAAAVKDIFSYKVVGFDGEYRMGSLDKTTNNLASYIQISTPVQCYVFNIVMLSAHKKSIEVLWEICSTEKILKVGHSINEDLHRIFRYFSKAFGINKRIKLHTCSIEQDLFTIKPPETISLSNISYRCLGKYMRKHDKSVRVGSKANLVNNVQIEYAALDALLPLEIYFKYSKVIQSSIPSSAVLKNSCYQKLFFIDKGLKVLMQPFESFKLNGIFLSNVTHQDIVGLCKKFPSRILITHDKSLLLDDNIPNKIPYFSNEQVFAEIKKINLEIFSEDSSSDDF